MNYIRINFRVTTPSPLSAGEQVFITGSTDSLGRWNPQGVPLHRKSDREWIGFALCPTAPFEFKITRGSWNSEETDQDGHPLPAQLIVTREDMNVERTVERWKDRLDQPRSHIEGMSRLHEAFKSSHLNRTRNIIVWLPPSYATHANRRYPVLYMHDGQQIFDPATSTWGQDWEVDEWCTKLIADNRLKEIIVVGAYSTDDRDAEYTPSLKGKKYAKFIVDELKPFIDKEYRTLPGREHTAVAGASMGGSISFYIAWHYPKVFFGAACLSPAFRHKRHVVALQEVKKAKKAPKLKLYLYCGEADDLESRLLPGAEEMVSLLREKGFTSGDHLRWTRNPMGQHNEATWAHHTDEWLLFLFGKKDAEVPTGTSA
ncbi:MAG: alpha/beta hydrolase [Verrucomicrobia bacterium]|nr:alpha/beta hydrolase [Verrucomicrobiota bacterium]